MFTQAEHELKMKRAHRREIANIALLGILSGDGVTMINEVAKETKTPFSEVLAKTAVHAADALLAELDKQVDQGSKPPEDVL